TTTVYLEEGAKRTFAVAVEWPGWARAARSADDALEALLAYADRYAAVPRAARIAFAKPSVLADLKVTERVAGTPTTDFGAPGVPRPSDPGRMTDSPRPASRRRPVRREGAEHYLFLTLISFAGTVIATRTFLDLTGYPRIGGGELHIAHALFGGLFLFVASLLPLVLAGRSVYR